MTSLYDLLRQTGPIRRKVFVSYHHELDSAWYNQFATWFGSTLELFANRSLTEPVDSDDLDYVHRAIRENNIRGTSLTIVLCGYETWKRKCIDWEIGSTLNMGHGLLGIGLPSAAIQPDGGVRVPDRFLVNFQSGYAPWLSWPPTSEQLMASIETAVSRARNMASDNSLRFMTRNRP